MTLFPLTELLCSTLSIHRLQLAVFTSMAILLLSGPGEAHARPSGFDGLFEEAMTQSRQQHRQSLRKSIADNPAPGAEQGPQSRRKLSSEERDALRRDLRDANRYGAPFPPRER